MGIDKIVKRINIPNYKYSRRLPEAFGVLSNPIRFKIYIGMLCEACKASLEEDGQFVGNCVSSIAKKIGQSQPTVSNHIRELVSAKLIRTVRKGRNVYLYGTRSLSTEFTKFSEYV